MITNLPQEKIVYLDETGFDQCLYRTHGRALKGDIIKGFVSGKRFRRTSLVAGLIHRKILISPFQYEGTMDSVLFEYCFTNHLVPELPQNSIIVMDNARFHRKSQLKEILSKTGH
ncbi:transposase [Ignatzschineria rhizosphaerae]|uniref:transposase n=1 Tax=Ignatzschineria rhizosphaerae TaxID=2923279 RepID=UPI003D8145FF